MEQLTKSLKISSILVLVLTGVSLLNIVSALCFGDLNSAEIPDGSPQNILMITKIFVLSFSFFAYHKIYAGSKGNRFYDRRRFSHRYNFLCDNFGSNNRLGLRIAKKRRVKVGAKAENSAESDDIF